MNLTYTIWIILAPFLAFVVVGLFSKTIKNFLASSIAIGSISLSALLSWFTAFNYFSDYGKITDGFKKVIAFKTTWLRFTESLQIDLGVLLDPVSVMMLVMVSTVSTIIFIYSIGYMSGHNGYNRFFAFLSLFTFSMMGLVVATNLFQMYIFWELVGVSSYLLIGFYYNKDAAVTAAKKAFIVTRFADLGFLLGILLLSFHTQTFDFTILNDQSNPVIATGIGQTFMGLSVLSWAMVLIFMGGAGKSAMFPLHIWLPDAMEGPTPVSALIHAATMVVAGVYLVARLFPVYFFGAPDILEVVALIGAVSSLFAAIIACSQHDIKRILAFSTMSQIGYMMLALGVSGYAENGLGFTASLFHLFTHAFFKALLFLGAGAIIHAVHTNNIKEMGGLRKMLPVTHITFLIACLAIAGIPPFAGFFSKDEILAAVWATSKVYFVIGYLVAGLTAFYMFRLYFMVFWNQEYQGNSQPHEAPRVMTIPLIFLAIGSASVGFIPFGSYISSNSQPLAIHFNVEMALAATLMALAGIVIAFLMYKSKSEASQRFRDTIGGLYTLIYRKFYFDELYLFITRKIIFNLISKPIAWFDRHVVDGTMNGVAYVTNQVSASIKGLQSGQLQQYAFIFLMGAVLFVLIFLYLWM